MRDPSRKGNTDAAALVADVLGTLKSTVEARADSPRERLFFPEGIDHISINVKAAGVELALVVTGPKSKPVLGDRVNAAARFDLEGLAGVLPAATGFVQLPQVSADYRVYEPANRQFGTQKTIDTIVEVARQVHGADAGLIFSVGATSRRRHSHARGQQSSAFSPWI